MCCDKCHVQDVCRMTFLAQRRWASPSINRFSVLMRDVLSRPLLRLSVCDSMLNDGYHGEDSHNGAPRPTSLPEAPRGFNPLNLAGSGLRRSYALVNHRRLCESTQTPLLSRILNSVLRTPNKRHSAVLSCCTARSADNRRPLLRRQF